MKTLISDNFLSKKECGFLINFYKQNEHNAFQFRDVFPLPLNINDQNIRFLILKIKEALKFFNKKIDWFQIVKWPIGSHQKLHVDDASNKTTLSSIFYLNDDFEGGQTYFKEGTIFKPKKGRALFFDGKYYTHGVKEVKNKTRYVVAAWYKNNEN